jgi:cell division septum initiation protein DivIVA
MNSKIEQTIEELEQYIDSCKPQAFSSNKIIVNKDQIEELLTELRLRTPEEIKRYQKMISNKEAILADAQSKADAIIAQAEVTHSELVSEHQIMQQAYAQANEVVMIATKQAQEILDNATNDANNIRLGAIGYTDELLKNLETILTNAIDGSKARYENLLTSLNSSLQVVLANRAELMPQTEPELSETEPSSEQPAEASEEAESESAE